jgi:hypothetical protein
MAVHDGPEHPVAVRLAEHDGEIFLDLADNSWQVIKITATSWQITTDCPVKFIRRRGMLPLPTPVKGGSLKELRPLVNLSDDDSWILYVAWMVAALRPGRPSPVLAVNGEQGSSKSTLCKMTRALIDPNQAPLRRPPRETRDLMIAATNGWIVAFDNLSGIAQDLSDAICMLSTGGGISTRELYTDAEEKLFDAIRPVMLNGIEDVATRPDLLDRAITLTLPEIPEDKRTDEEGLWKQFEQHRPRILGALLDSVSAALQNRASIHLPNKPRMADFACWVVAAEPVLPWSKGDFLKAYSGNRSAANSLALESSIVSAPIQSLVAKTNTFKGTVRMLLTELEGEHTDEKTRRRKDWPDTARKLSGELRRLAPSLRRVGIVVTFGKHTKKGTLITIERTPDSAGETPSLPSPPSPSSEIQENSGVCVDGPSDGRVTVCDDLPSDCHPDRHSDSPRKHGENDHSDDGDGGDGVLHTQSAVSTVEGAVNGRVGYRLASSGGKRRRGRL